jgi:hypothetical protein
MSFFKNLKILLKKQYIITYSASAGAFFKYLWGIIYICKGLKEPSGEGWSVHL